MDKLLDLERAIYDEVKNMGARNALLVAVREGNKAAKDIKSLLETLDIVRQENATLTAALAEAQEIIKSIEWGVVDNWGASCPDCGNYRKQNNGQHMSNCKLAAWLAKYPQP